MMTVMKDADVLPRSALDTGGTRAGTREDQVVSLFAELLIGSFETIENVVLISAALATHDRKHPDAIQQQGRRSVKTQQTLRPMPGGAL